MSSNHWQIRKQAKQYNGGRTTTSRVEAYVRTWEGRCYPFGIPDDVPELLSRSNRAPSYKAIAVAILRNDLLLKSLGYAGITSATGARIEARIKRSEGGQIDMEGFSD